MVYYHTVPLGLGLPGIPAFDPLRTVALLRNAQSGVSEYLGSSEPIWGDTNPDGPLGSAARWRLI